MNIHVIVVGYNVRPDWVKRCLSSISAQDGDFRVVVVDDASTDVETIRAIEDFSSRHAGPEWQFLRNDTNLKAPYTIMEGILAAAPRPEDVILLVDLDDFLPPENPFVIGRFREIYADPEVWLTYGQYRPFPTNTGQALAAPYPPDWIKRRAFRTPNAFFNHPITFRYFLFESLKVADFMTNQHRWFKGGYDKVLIIPMLELASPYFRFLDEVLYVYNAENPLSDSMLEANRALCEEANQIWSRPPKEPLNAKYYIDLLRGALK